MAGHSKFKNIQHRKGAQDKKRAKVFTKLVREIITSAKIGGIDSSSNPRLRSAISAARSQNLPKERIDRALSQASDPTGGDNYTEIRYEGFVPGGIAIIVETLTDNKNRTASDVRSAFTKYGGNLGETGSVSFMFDKVGSIVFDKKVSSNEEVFESAIEAGASDVISDDEGHVIYTEVEGFSECLEFLIKKYGDPVESGIEWKPQNLIVIDSIEKAEKLVKLIDALEESDDVQNVFVNYELSEELYNKLYGD
jgi:YebC/PmpR family DNA-binding regulatory protein